MMKNTKVALISDIHLGIRNDSLDFLHNQEKFFTNVFFSECEKRNVHTVIHCGDLTDRRKNINFNTANKSKAFLFEKIKDKKQTWYSLVGNHDSYYKNTIKINSHRELNVDQYGFHIIDEPQEIFIFDEKLCMIPWMCNDNEEKCLNLINSTNAQYCFGHFSIKNFEMQKGRICENGLDQNLFSKFTQVFSGHFHKSSAKGNILYLGSPCQYTWNDYGDDRGFYIFDLKTQDLEYIPNPYKMFTKVEYDDTESDEKNLAFNKKAIENTFCKIIVKNQTDKKRFKKFIENFDSDKMLDLKIIDQTNENIKEKEVSISDIEDTKTILLKYSEGKKELQNFLLDLYSEALLLE